jgi:hypothetical protein
MASRKKEFDIQPGTVKMFDEDIGLINAIKKGRTDKKVNTRKYIQKLRGHVR